MSLSTVMTVNKGKDTNQVLFTDKLADLLLVCCYYRF
jgi:hypothetical protein